METKHTPGPWEVRKTASGNPFIYAGQLNVAGVAIARPGIDSATSAANARLIAAAPETAAERDRLKEINAELLEALLLCRQWGVTEAETTGGLNWALDVVPKIEAAIAKATGGAA